MSDTLLKVDGLSREFDISKAWLGRVLEGEGRQTLKAVRDVSFDIPRGQTLGLVGESGCGKTTIARIVVGLMTPTAGRIHFDGVGVGGPRWAEQRRRVQMIFQDPYASLNPRWRVDRIVAEPIRAFRLLNSRDAIADRVDELLRMVGLDPLDGTKYPHEFSGGQRQRIAIARALASEPDFIVCDEPTSALDVSVQAQVLNLMRELQRKLELTYLLISHDLAVVRHMADVIGVMYLGRLVEIAPKRQVFESPRHPYTRLLLDAVPDIELIGKPRRMQDETALADEIPSPLNPPSGCAFHPRCPLRFAPCDKSSPELKSWGQTLVACHDLDRDSFA